MPAARNNGGPNCDENDDIWNSASEKGKKTSISEARKILKSGNEKTEAARYSLASVDLRIVSRGA